MSFRDAPLVKGFDPNGDGYDIDTALAAGATPDEGHWQSIDPRTGMVLKGRGHATWDKTIAAETELGNTVAQADDGRYYSTKQPKFRSAPLVDEDPDTPENFAERAKRDYDFAIENKVDFGFGDAVRREWGTTQGLQSKIPFAGSLYTAFDNVEMVAAVDRLKNDSYEQAYAEESALEQHLPLEEQISSRDEFVENFRQQDKDSISAYLKYVTADKTTMAKITEGVSQLPTWFLEFAATGGLASLGDDIATKAGEKILGNYAKTATGKVVLRTAGWSSGAFTRSFGLSTQIGEKFTQQTLDEVLGLEEESEWGTKFARAWGDVYIESLSEALFGAGKAALIDEGVIFKGLSKLPLGKKLFPKMKSSWMKATGGTSGQFIKKMTSKGGYSNIIGEIGEERFGTLLRGIANVDDFGLDKDSTPLQRLKAGFTQDVENMWVELGVLSFPAGVQYVGGKVFDRERIDKVRTELGGQSEELAKQEESARKVRELIDTEVETQPTEATETKKPTEGKVEGVEGEKPSEAKQEAVSPAKQVNPTRVEDANLNNEVDNVVGQLMTNKADPSKTSLKQEDVQEGRKVLGLDGVASAARKSQLKDLQIAKDGGFVENAEDNANRALGGGEQLNRIESAGALVRMAQLLNQYKVKKALLAEATENLSIATLNTEMERIVSRYDSLSTAVHRSGSEAGRRLAMQKLTIDENYDYLSVTTRYKARKGKVPTQKQDAKLRKLTDELAEKDRTIERLRIEVAEAMASDFLRKGKVARYSGMNRAEVLSERESLTSAITELLDEGC